MTVKRISSTAAPQTGRIRSVPTREGGISSAFPRQRRWIAPWSTLNWHFATAAPDFVDGHRRPMLNGLLRIDPRKNRAVWHLIGANGYAAIALPSQAPIGSAIATGADTSC
jgi:hypothetical protein